MVANRISKGESWNGEIYWTELMEGRSRPLISGAARCLHPNAKESIFHYCQADSFDQVAPPNRDHKKSISLYIIMVK